ncbi:hypothetical protein [Streptomyces sp. NPDC046939]|uniref:hypothetical protein n=1 Tax=Streptomyces sp. NPDC046939 TaxID=3155376 RepID=UPI0033EEB6B1
MTMRRPLRGAAALAVSVPEPHVYSYGFHGAVAELCKSRNTDCHDFIQPQKGRYVDLTPINSLHLREHYQ